LGSEGRSVTLVDPRPGGIASPGSFGWLNAASAEDAPYCAVRQRSLALWHRLARQHPDCPISFPGFLLWEVPPDELEAMAGRLDALGHPAELVDRAAIARLEPGLTAAPETALWLPTEGRADPRAIAEWFARAAGRAGATLCPKAVTGIERTGRDAAGRWQLRLGRERLGADELVIAAGAATPGLLEPLGHALALRTEPGLLVRTAPAPRSLGVMLGSPEVHLWQAADGTVLAGSDYGGTQRFEDPQAEAQAILARAESLVAGLGRLQSDAVSITDRPMLPDDRPAVGRLAEGLHVAVTHSGMTLAPLIAEAVAAGVAGHAPDPRLAAYRPDRPAVSGAAVA
jgi:glycine/D-amino acid oxidase-like deaminating enzyme